MELTVYTADGGATKRTVALDPTVFEVEPNDHAIWLDVRRIQASARQGTHKAKERGETRGSTRKLYRQKGTGFARAGSAKSPTRRSGGTIFGPRPRSYDFKVNKKTSQLARRSAFTYKAREEGLRVIEDLKIDGASTKELVGLLAALELTGTKVLILTNDHSPAVYQSSRNLRKVKVQEARKASTLDILGARIIVAEETAFQTLSEQLGNAEAQSA
jgi:large subunit ribosomal protein L4